MKLTAGGLLVPLSQVPALLEALVDGQAATQDDDMPCRDCDVFAARGLMCGEHSVSQTRHDAYGGLLDAFEVAEEKATVRTGERLEEARADWRKEVGDRD